MMNEKELKKLKEIRDVMKETDKILEKRTKEEREEEKLKCIFCNSNKIKRCITDREVIIDVFIIPEGSPMNLFYCEDCKNKFSGQEVVSAILAKHHSIE